MVMCWNWGLSAADSVVGCAGVEEKSLKVYDESWGSGSVVSTVFGWATSGQEVSVMLA